MSFAPHEIAIAVVAFIVFLILGKGLNDLNDYKVELSEIGMGRRKRKKGNHRPDENPESEVIKRKESRFHLKDVHDERVISLFRQGDLFLDQIEQYLSRIKKDHVRKTAESIYSTIEAIFLSYIDSPHKVNEAFQIIRLYSITTINILKNYTHIENTPFHSEKVDEACSRTEEALEKIDHGFVKIQTMLLSEDLEILQIEMDVIKSDLKIRGL